MKKILAFDVDNTLNLAKTPVEPDMALIMLQLLDKFEVAPISGQKFVS